MGIIKKTVRFLRNNQTFGEDIFWNLVRNKRFLGLRFQRQYPIKYVFGSISSFFVADFYCHKLKLIIEIDGSIHHKIKERDKIREFIIKNNNLKIFRVTNKEIISNPEKVLKELELFIKLPPLPLP